MSCGVAFFVFCQGHVYPRPYGMNISSLGLMVFVAITDIHGLPVFLHIVGDLPLPSRALFLVPGPP